MEIFELLETIERILEESKGVPFSKQYKMVNPEEVLEIVDEIRKKMPEEIKQARWIKEERMRILQEAKKESEAALKEAERRIIEMIDEHEITKKAEQRSEDIIDEAKKQAREISEGTRNYADSVLAHAEEAVKKINNSVEIEMNEIRAALNRLKKDREELK